MVIQNSSIEGANDEAIEDAASRIHEASRVQQMNIDNNHSRVIIVHEKSYMVISPPLKNKDDDYDGVRAFDGDNSTRSITTRDNYTEDDDIESNILYLEEKKRILKKVKIHREKEKAYIALNAHRIANGWEPPSRRSRSSSIWSEAKAMIEEFKLDGVGRICSDSEEGSSSEMVSSASIGTETQGSPSLYSSPEICQHPSTLSSSPPDTHVKNTSRTRKRQKIDISEVKHISSTEYAKECAGNEVEETITEDRDVHRGSTRRSSTRQHCVSPTARCQQAREMQLSMGSRKWTSQAVLKQIFGLTRAAISEHRRSIIGTGKGE